MAGKPVDLGILGAFPGGNEVVNGAFGGACKSVFGTGVVAFTPTALNWVAPDGHEEILNHVEYRSDGPNVIVIPSDPDPIPFIFGFPTAITRSPPSSAAPWRGSPTVHSRPRRKLSRRRRRRPPRRIEALFCQPGRQVA
jgi:hypothetical protein